MGIKNNFEKALKKAISKDPMGYKAILDEDHDCEKIHPEMTHEEWSKTKEEEMDEATTAASAGAEPTRRSSELMPSSPAIGVSEMTLEPPQAAGFASHQATQSP